MDEYGDNKNRACTYQAIFWPFMMGILRIQGPAPQSATASGDGAQSFAAQSDVQDAQAKKTALPAYCTGMPTRSRGHTGFPRGEAAGRAEARRRNDDLTPTAV